MEGWSLLISHEKHMKDAKFLTTWRLFEVQKPTQTLKSVKGPGNTFELIPKWSRTLPSLIYFSWDIYRGV
jgi:hypothetical protein